MNAVVPVSHSAPADLSDWYGSMMGRTGDWYGSMMGGLKESIANVVAGDDLDQLARSISKFQDALVSSYDQVTALREQEAQVQALAPQVVGPPVPGDTVYEQFLSAQKAVQQGYQALTGFDYMTQVIANVFTPNAAKLESVYSGLTGLIGSIRNWNDTWQSQIGSQHPDMVQLWNSIQNLHNRLYASASGGKALNFDDPQYLATAQQAVQQLTGISPAGAAEFGMGDFGITALIATIVIAVAAVGIAIAVVALAKQFNVAANNAFQLRQDYEKRMDTQRTDYINKRVAEGASVAVAQSEWESIKAREDQAEKAKEADVAARGPGADITKILT
jgi:hypothetical protein